MDEVVPTLVVLSKLCTRQVPPLPCGDRTVMPQGSMYYYIGRVQNPPGHHQAAMRPWFYPCYLNPFNLGTLVQIEGSSHI